MKFIMLPVLLICNTLYGKDNVKIHGKIERRLADSLNISYSITSILYAPVTKSIFLGPDGSFKAGIEVPEGFTEVTIMNGNQQTSVFVQPGDDLELTIDAANFDSAVHYTGNGSDVANFMAKCELESHTHNEFAKNGDKLMAKDIPEFRSAMKELLNKETEYIDKNETNLPPSFTNYIKTYYLYEDYCEMEKYPRIHEMIMSHKMNSDIPKENYAILDDIPEAFNDKYINIPSYRSYLNNFYATKLEKENANKETPVKGFSMDSLLARAYRFMPPVSAAFHAAQRINNGVRYTPLEQVDQEFITYRSHFPDGKYLGILQQTIAGLKKTGAGKPEIDFDIQTPDGAKMKLSDLKGKVVYIDFWSRGCVPCIGEMKGAKKVRAHFKDKPVAFVYVSLDDNDSIWKKAIQDFQIDGINTHVDKGYQSEIIKKYEVNSIPSHFLIDKYGNFAKVDVVESPLNDEKLVAQIEKLLQ